jgi:hypothetical protein
MLWCRIKAQRNCAGRAVLEAAELDRRLLRLIPPNCRVADMVMNGDPALLTRGENS